MRLGFKCQFHLFNISRDSDSSPAYLMYHCHETWSQFSAPLSRCIARLGFMSQVLCLLALSISLECWQVAIGTLQLVITLSLWPIEFPASIIHCISLAPNHANCRCLNDVFLTYISPFHTESMITIFLLHLSDCVDFSLYSCQLQCLPYTVGTQHNYSLNMWFFKLIFTK